MRLEAFAAAAAAAFLLGAAGAAGGEGLGPAAAAPEETAGAATFQVYHYASEVEGNAFREVFLVHAVSPLLRVAAADVELRVNGEPRAVDWEDGDGRLSVADRFSFVQEAFDEKQVLTGHVGGRQVMECRFGGGAGLPISPDEWRDLGMPEQVRCLQLTDDQ